MGTGADRHHSGACHCKAIHYRFTSATALSDFSVRACDCTFCRAHGAAYISDPQGSLTLFFQDRSQVRFYRQGSNTADFILCAHCGVLVCALHSQDGERAVINARTLADFASLPPARTTSFSDAGAEQKQQRWRQTWIGRVVIHDLH